MKSPLWIVLMAAAVLLATGSTFALMNNACKSNHHSWCAPSFEIRHKATIEHS